MNGSKSLWFGPSDNAGCCSEQIDDRGSLYQERKQNEHRLPFHSDDGDSRDGGASNVVAICAASEKWAEAIKATAAAAK